MNSCIFEELDRRIKEGIEIDSIIPYSCEGYSRDDYIRLLAIYMTHGFDERRRLECQRKWEYETR